MPPGECALYRALYLLVVAVSALTILIWLIAATALIGVLIQPWRTSEWMWALGGAVLMVLVGAVPASVAAAQVLRGGNVYAFLIGIIALAELARREHVFDRLAEAAFDIARGSRARLFLLVYAAGAVVTVLLSNDTTAIVLTPAVFAVVRQSDAEPLPYLYACAFVANAASYVLPISNPANLVYFGDRIPRLAQWLGRFGLSALAAIVVVYLVLYLLHARLLSAPLRRNRREQTPPAPGGGLAALAISLSVVALLLTAATGVPVGLTALLCAAASVTAVGIIDREAPRRILRAIAWHVILLVAGLFVIVAALDRAGSLQLAQHFLESGAALARPLGDITTGAGVALGANLFNNLFVAMAAGQSIAHIAVPQHIVDAALVGVDVGPNLSVTSSLATLLWLITLRREGLRVTPMQFLKIGAAVILPALLVAELLSR